MDDADMFDFDDLDPDEREQAAELFRLNAQMDDEQEALRRIEREDPVGLVMFGESYVDDEGHPQHGDPDAWLDARR